MIEEIAGLSFRRSSGSYLYFAVLEYWCAHFANALFSAPAFFILATPPISWYTRPLSLLPSSIIALDTLIWRSVMIIVVVRDNAVITSAGTSSAAAYLMI